MIINSTPIFVPISTANVPTETVRNETRLQERIPETKPSTENVNLKPGADDTNASNRSENRGTQESQDNRSVNERSDNPQGDNEKDGESQQERQEQRQEQENKQQVEQLKSRDREVRAHEAAHAAVGGQYAGAPSYTFQTGPDGRRYAVGGEVPIDIGVVSGNPEATIRKMQQVRRAALAPQDPSAQDQSVAAQATAQEAAARAELAQQRRDSNQSSSDPNENGSKSRFEIRLQRLGAVDSNETGSSLSVVA
ncbi:MAG: catalase [Gammaproteobacteria bacterium]|nr:catalase [Gammaproteobacteria bacterium]